MRRHQLLALAFLVASHNAVAQSREQTDRLAGLGMVWGFLKYNHPGVATGKMHWDSALVSTVPRVRSVRSEAEYHAVIQSLLDLAGEMRKSRTAAYPCGTMQDVFPARDCPPMFVDTTRTRLDRSLSNVALLGADIVGQLTRIRDNPHSGSGRYVNFKLTAMFDTDTAFGSPAYPGEGQRLLALFRLWNAVRYYFPYLSVNGGDWNAVLTEFIPRMIAAQNADEYQLAIAELASRLNDAHVSAGSSTLSTFFGPRTPAFESRMIEGKVVVWKLATDSSLNGGLRVGDVITGINGTSVADRRRELTKYIAAGNDAVFERKLLSQMLRNRGDDATYAVERDGTPLNVRVPMARPAPAPGLREYPVKELAWVLPGTKIGYVNMGNLNPAQVAAAIAIVRETDGIIMDVRNYPRGTMYQFAQFFNPGPTPFVKFTRADSTYPGRFIWVPPVPAGPPNPRTNSYAGRVAILIDERTQSHAEFTAMALRTAPSNRVIGSQTAGADGNVTFFSLPGGIRAVFTGLGVYYPDGRDTQRIGIVPDIEIRPTIAGLRAGRDEVLERAIAYMKSGQ